MLKKTMTYTDFDGMERTEDFYFNLTEAEIIEMDMSTEGGLEQMIHKISSEQNKPRIIAIFKEIILKAYGEKSLDGKRFMKNPKITEEFSQTQAYSDLFMSLASDPDEASAFINGIVPRKKE